MLASAARIFLPGLALSAIVVGLAAGGANTAELASLLSCALVALAMVSIALSPGEHVTATLKANAISAFAALAFLALALATSLKQLGFPDPLWAAFGFSDGATSISPYRTIEGAASFLSAIAAFAIGALAVQARSHRDGVGRLVVFATLAFAIFALVVQQAVGIGRRLTVNFGSSNAAATLFGMAALFCAAFVVRAARGPRTASAQGGIRWAKTLTAAPFGVMALVLSLLCLLLTASRAGILSSVAGFIAFAVLLAIGQRMSERTSSQSALVWLSAFAALLFLIGGHYVLERLASLDADAAVRASIVETHWRAFLDRPLFGHGLNTFHELNAHYATPQTYAALRELGAAHNVYVQALEETGIIGAGLFVLMLGPPIWRALSAAALGRSGRHWAAAACAAALLVFLHGMVDFGLQAPAIAALFSFCLGAFSVRLRAQRVEAEAPAEKTALKPLEEDKPEEKTKAEA